MPAYLLKELIKSICYTLPFFAYKFLRKRRFGWFSSTVCYLLAFAPAISAIVMSFYFSPSASDLQETLSRVDPGEQKALIEHYESMVAAYKFNTKEFFMGLALSFPIAGIFYYLIRKINARASRNKIIK